MSARLFSNFRRTFCLMALSTLFWTLATHAQTPPQPTPDASQPVPLNWPPPVHDNEVFEYLNFNQLEGRITGPQPTFRWDGEGWIGTNKNKLWLKSEGDVSNGTMSDGDHEALYDRPIPHLRYFDWQAGVRADLDSGPKRTWGAIGIQGLAPYFFEFAPTFYFRDGGHVAGRFEGSYNLYVTQRLVLQPQIEMNFYNKPDPARGIGRDCPISTAELGSAIKSLANLPRTLVSPIRVLSAKQRLSPGGRASLRILPAWCLEFGSGGKFKSPSKGGVVRLGLRGGPFRRAQLKFFRRPHSTFLRFAPVCFTSSGLPDAMMAPTPRVTLAATSVRFRKYQPRTTA